MPKIRTLGGEQFSLKDAMWNLTNEQTKERTAQAFLRVSDEGMDLAAIFVPALLLIIPAYRCSAVQ